MSRNTITKERYNKIKPHVSNPKNDEKNMRRFSIGQTTIRYIRNTKDFKEFQSKGTVARKQRKTEREIEQLFANSPREIYSGLNICEELPAAEKRHRNIIDILVLLAIAALIVGVIIFGGK